MKTTRAPFLLFITCFGGRDGKTLFTTARKSLYAIAVTTTGAAP